MLHVVGLLTADGRYGGPQRVALDLAAEQREQGLDVFVVSGSAHDSPYRSTESVRTFRSFRLLPQLGYAGLVSPGMVFWLFRHFRRFDVIHVHLARDLTTLPIAAVARAFKRNYVLQTHGMIDKASNIAAKILDFVAVRGVAAKANRIFALTPSEAEDIKRLAPHSAVALLDNGIRISEPHHLPRTNVTFLARLHPRKGGKLFAEAVNLISKDFPDVSFILAGPDEGDLQNILATARKDGSPKLKIIGPVDPTDVPLLMASSLIYVLPAPGEPFGMTVLEAMVEETAVVINRTAELADRLHADGCVATFDGSATDLATVIVELLTDRRGTERLGRLGRQVAQRKFSLSFVAEQVSSAYP
ncbi:glycosyltransferase [Curtobacterium sp. Csp2]|uniref:glycosyltransferase n=1 Tax=Curtobacterium sp. Csp2 TaxID=2495430 RepID=UPI00158035D4|nr:glycosyltransferase [Curtobacterium sp. Csp2]QKS17545.1 glycosyltransferase [Curtobacterium sp. Csp2]